MYTFDRRFEPLSAWDDPTPFTTPDLLPAALQQTLCIAVSATFVDSLQDVRTTFDRDDLSLGFVRVSPICDGAIPDCLPSLFSRS